MRDGDRFAPLPSPDLLNLGEVSSTNPENNLFCCYLFRTRPLKEAREFAERARANIIQGSDLLCKFLIAPPQNLCAAKS